MNHRQPPHSKEAEQSVLGTVLLRPSSLDDILEIVKAEDFYIHAHRKIFQAMTDMSTNDEQVDVLTLSSRLDKLGDLEAAGGVEYLGELAGSVVTANHFKSYSVIVKDFSTRRNIAEVCSDYYHRSFDEDDPESVLNAFQSDSLALTTQVGEKFHCGLAEAARDTLLMYEDIEKHGWDKSGVPTGVGKLDNLLCGLKPGQHVVIGARTSIGKTSMALCWTLAQLKAGHRVAYFSPEMTRTEIAEKLISSISGVDPMIAKRGKLTDMQWEEIANATNLFQEYDLTILDGHSYSVADIRREARRMKKDRLDILYIDQLQHLQPPPGEKDENKAVGKNSRALKVLAKELGIPVVVVSMLTQDDRGSQNKRPGLGNLRGSANIEYDANIVILLHRDITSNGESVEMECILAKNRGGKTGFVNLTFDRVHNRIWGEW